MAKKAKKAAPAAAKKPTDKVKVRLLVSRTNFGAIGDVVEYEYALAADHVARGLVAFADDESDDAADDAGSDDASSDAGTEENKSDEN